MRKRNKGKILSRPKNQRQALLRSLAGSLFLHGKIKTTKAKAKQLRPFAEKLITRAKSNSISNRKLVARDLSPDIVKKVFEEIAPKYMDRHGGYTRVINLGPRKSDGAQMSIIELVE